MSEIEILNPFFDLLPTVDVTKISDEDLLGMQKLMLVLVPEYGEFLRSDPLRYFICRFLDGYEGNDAYCGASLILSNIIKTTLEQHKRSNCDFDNRLLKPSTVVRRINEQGLTAYVLFQYLVEYHKDDIHMMNSPWIGVDCAPLRKFGFEVSAKSFKHQIRLEWLKRINKSISDEVLARGLV